MDVKILIIKDLKLNKEMIFLGTRQVAEFLGVSRSTVYRYRNTNRIIKGKYLVYDADYYK